MRKIKIVFLIMLTTLSAISQNITVKDALKYVESDPKNPYVKALSIKEVKKKLKELQFTIDKKSMPHLQKENKYLFSIPSKKIHILSAELSDTRQIWFFTYDKSIYDIWLNECKTLGFVPDKETYSKDYPTYTLNDKIQIKQLGFAKSHDSYTIFIQEHPAHLFKKFGF